MEPLAPVRDLPSLTGLRAPAALAVFIGHAAFFASPLVPGFRIAFLGYIGVPFFFVVSGAVLAWSNPTPTSTAFWWRRLARIYPLHLVATALALIVYSGQHLVPVLASVFLVQTWWPSWHEAGNNVSWSLCCEAFFYAAFPWLVSRLGRLTARDQWRAGLFFYAVISVVLVAGSVVAGGRYDDPLHWFPVTNAPPFVLGVVVGLRLHDGWRPRLQLRTAWLVTIGALGAVVALRVAAAGHSTTGIVITIVTPALVVLVVAHAASDIRGEQPFFAHPRLVYAGAVSFAFYLIHFTIITFTTIDLGLVPGSAVAALLLIVPLFGASAAAAVALHHGVELPARRFLLTRSRQ